MLKETQGLWTSHRQHVLARILLLVLGCVVAVSVLSTLSAGATAAPRPKQGEHLKPKPGTTLLTYRGHSSRVNGVAWSPSGLRIASGSDDYTVQVWNASNGGNVLTDNTGGLVEAVAWSPNGLYIASAGGGPDVWNATTGKLIYTYRGHSLIGPARKTPCPLDMGI
jgi:WD40 repeat protein